MTENAPKTAAARAHELNVTFRAECEAQGSQLCGTLVEDAAFWAGWDIHTAEELDHHLAAGSYVDAYKETHNIKPRWMDLDAYTTEELESMTAELYEDAWDDGEWDALDAERALDEMEAASDSRWKYWQNSQAANKPQEPWEQWEAKAEAEGF